MHVKTGIMEKLQLLGRKYKYPALILALGVLLLLFPTGKESDVEETAAAPSASGEFDLSQFTSDAEDLLSGLSGAGRVRLLLALETDGENTFLTDENRSEGEGNTQLQSQAVLVKEGSDEVPVSVTSTFPTFRGAVVLCQGAQDPKVILGIKEAISSLTGLGMDKITVLKMD